MARDSAGDWKKQAIDPTALGGRPALKPETIAPADAVVITVADVDRFDVDDPDSETGKRQVMTLHSDEYPDKSFFLNKTGTKTLIEKIGDKPSDWIGEKVPLVVVRVNNPRSGGAVKTIQVAPPAEWNDIVKQFAGRSRAKAKARKR